MIGMSNNNFDNFISIEEDTKVLEYKFNFDDFLMWPIVRYVVFSKAIGQYNSNVPKVRTLKKDFLKYIVLNIMRYPHFVSDKDIISFGTTLDNILINGKYFNRVHDYYNFLFADSTIFFELPDGFTYRRPRVFSNTYYHDYMRAIPLLKSKLIGDIDNESRNMVIEFMEYLKSDFPVSFDTNFYDLIQTLLVKEAKRIKYRKQYFLKLIDKIKPKVLFLNCAYYGGESYMIKWAKERGIITAEFQHGTISKSHPAYNYGEGVRNSEEYKKYVPDYLLTYGEYWNSQVRIPGKTYVVGNPHFYESIKRYENIKEEKDTILIISQWTLTKEFVEITEYLAKHFRNKKILFKMHPREMDNFCMIEPLENFPNVQIKKDGDVYELLAKCENVVGCYSTAIFEALAFDKKKIYVLENSFSRDEIPEDIGVRFKNGKELAELMEAGVTNEKYLDVKHYFNSNWKENYISFINDELKLSIR